jgi:hypothetical protein
VTEQSGANVRLAELAGEIKTLRETLDGRLNLHERDITSLKLRMEQSETFRVERRKRWDHFDGVQEAEKKIQAARHEENVQNLQKVANKIGTGNLIIVLLGLLLSIAVAIVGYQAGVHHAKLDPYHLLTHDPQPSVAHYNAKDE